MSLVLFFKEITTTTTEIQALTVTNYETGENIVEFVSNHFPGRRHNYNIGRRLTVRVNTQN